MKKLIAILLAVAMLASMATVASAKEYAKEYEMSLKTTVPAATYTLLIPESADVAYGATNFVLPPVELVASAGFQVKDLCIEVWDPVFFGEGTSYVLDMEVAAGCVEPGHYINLVDGANKEGHCLYYTKADANGSLDPEYCCVLVGGEQHQVDRLVLRFNQEDWAYLEPGEYTGHICFRTYVVPNVGEE